MIGEEHRDYISYTLDRLLALKKLRDNHPEIDIAHIDFTYREGDGYTHDDFFEEVLSRITGSMFEYFDCIDDVPEDSKYYDNCFWGVKVEKGAIPLTEEQFAEWEKELAKVYAEITIVGNNLLLLFECYPIASDFLPFFVDLYKKWLNQMGTVLEVAA